MSIDLFLDDKKFISVKRASQETGYTQDYIGQLCRQNKVPAKLIGRTWFVDFESLKIHKTGASSRASKKNTRNIYQGINPSEPKTEEVYTPKQYSSELIREKIPNLSEKRDSSRKIFSGSHLSSTLVTTFVTVFIISSVSFSWISFLSPQTAQKIDSIILSVHSSVFKTFASLKNKLNFLALVEESLWNESQVEDDALVIFPDEENRDKRTESIKNNFSDEVEVLFDKEGESGVIRPIFRPGEESENYAFVLVPIKEKK